MAKAAFPTDNSVVSGFRCLFAFPSSVSLSWLQKTHTQEIDASTGMGDALINSTERNHINNMRESGGSLMLRYNIFHMPIQPVPSRKTSLKIA